MKTPCNIVFQIEDGAKRRSIHGSVVFNKPGQTVDDASDALKRNGFEPSQVPVGYKRTLYQLTPHAGGQVFEFFISDQPLEAEAGT